MSNTTITNIAKVASLKIIGEMEKRGFTTEIPDAVFGLHDAITEIIRETFEGNVNYGIEVKTMSDHCPEDGWIDDLQNRE